MARAFLCVCGRLRRVTSDPSAADTAPQPNGRHIAALLPATSAAGWGEFCLGMLRHELGPRLRRYAGPDDILRDAAATAEADLLILLGDREIAVADLPRPRLGIWRLGFGTEAGLRPGLTGVRRALLRGAGWVDIHVLQLAPDGASEGSAHRVTIALDPAHPEQTLRRINLAAARCLRGALLRALADGAARPIVPAPPLLPDNTRRLGGLVEEALSPLAAVWWFTWTYAWRWLLFRDHWRLGLVDQPLGALVAGEPAKPITWLPEAGDLAFVADPFVGRLGDNDLLLAERFDFRTSHGEIVAAALGADGTPGHFAPLLRTLSHLSYPSLVAERGRLWLCPEAWESGELRLHAIDLMDGRPTIGETRQLLPGFPAVDPTIIRHQGTWYLFCGDRRDAPNENMKLWFADRLEGPWTPHPWNPVVSDLGHARPAGAIIAVDGMLIRPAQDCRLTYGGAVSLMRIDCLSRSAYRESRIARLDPEPDGPCPDGLHTVAAFGRWTIIDGKRWRFSLRNPLLKLSGWLRNRRRRCVAVPEP